MKQKIVVKVQMTCEKCRTKAMQTAAGESGVSSVQISGKDKDEVVVVGEEIDAVCLTRSLRKKVGYAILHTVEEVKETKKEKPKPDDSSASDARNQSTPSPPLWGMAPCPQFVVCHEMVPDPCQGPCWIM